MENIEEAFNEYVSKEFYEPFRQEALNKHKDKKWMEDRFGSIIQFGTAGLREVMTAGRNAMNDLVVLLTSQGLCKYILNRFGPEICSSRGVVIGFDGRYNSRRFAHVAAAVFLSKGFKVYLNDRVTPTPMCPYGVTTYSALGGIQITASHNPKEYNGYKVYSSSGAQIVPPMDSEIQSEIKGEVWPEAVALLDHKSGYLNETAILKTINPYTSLFELYMKDMAHEFRDQEIAFSDAPHLLKIVYTALHGVGSRFVEELIVNRSLYPKDSFISVPEQNDPNPEFPTVSFPNPEEPGALDRAISLADRVGSSLIIANDPDADRFAAAEKRPDGSWYIFKGDELGVLFAAYMMDLHRARGRRMEDIYFICSAVSSRMMQKMAEANGAIFKDTLTGFKWIMDKALSLNRKGKRLGCCYEEALGYGLSIHVPDKDGISASLAFLQMANKLKNHRNLTVYGYLEQLRQKYGYFVTNNSYITADKKIIDSIFKRLRVQYPDSIGSQFKIKRIRDVTKGYDTIGDCELPVTPSNHMITFFFENGAVITLRGSGTEPKLKWYAELGGGTDSASTKQVLDQMVEALKQSILT